MGNIMEHVGVF